MARKIVIVADNDTADALVTQLGSDESVQIESVEPITYYVHKYEERQQYGGPEEGGWWYDQRTPVQHAVYSSEDEEDATEKCRALNRAEYERREGLSVRYSSVLSHRETFYTYSVREEPVAVDEPEHRPHYE
jgi:hypothetical protein